MIPNSYARIEGAVRPVRALRCLCVWVLLFLCASSSFAATATVRLLDEGEGRYRLEAEGWQDVAAVDIILYFNSMQVTVGTVDPGPMLRGFRYAENRALSGQLRLGALRDTPVSGAGTIARLSAVTNLSEGAFRAMRVRLSDGEGSNLEVSAALPNRFGTLAATIPEIVATSELNLSGSPEVTLKSETTPVVVVEDPLPPVTEAVGEPAPLAYREVRRSATEAVGTENPERSELFLRPLWMRLSDAEAAEATLDDWRVLLTVTRDGIRQSPSFPLSDGRQEVTLYLPAEVGAIQGVAVENARLLGSGSTSNGEEWVRVVPAKGAQDVELVLFTAKREVIFPLQVAPLIENLPVVLPDQRLPQIDSDGDGRFTTADAYRLAINLLVRAGEI
ncbi:MAG: hypothetical protein C0621_00885 [Desulfuromonas sp.]|nr:MAG: hypothetical protein C0621_00885 [Desulfuromonas sp.]